MYAGISEATHAIKTGARLRVATVPTTETAALSARAMMHNISSLRVSVLNSGFHGQQRMVRPG
jgi:hypothetical protein